MTVNRNQLRHFVHFHNPDESAMGVPFEEVGGGPGDDVPLWVYTNKQVRDYYGDVVWLLSRREVGPPYFLYGKLRMEIVQDSDHPDFAYEIGGQGIHLADVVTLEDQAWFKRLLMINPNLSQGLQAVSELEIIKGLQDAFPANKLLKPLPKMSEIEWLT